MTDRSGGSEHSPTRFRIRADPWWRPLLLIVGVFGGNRYVEIGPERLVVRFGWFRYELPRAGIVAGRTVKPDWWWGIGVHTSMFGGLLVNGSLGGVVELEISPPVWLWLLFIPTRCARFLVSLEEPAAFLRALGLSDDQPTGA